MKSWMTEYNRLLPEGTRVVPFFLSLARVVKFRYFFSMCESSLSVAKEEARMDLAHVIKGTKWSTIVHWTDRLPSDKRALSCGLLPEHIFWCFPPSRSLNSWQLNEYNNTEFISLLDRISKYGAISVCEGFAIILFFLVEHLELFPLSRAILWGKSKAMKFDL